MASFKQPTTRPARPNSPRIVGGANKSSVKAGAEVAKNRKSPNLSGAERSSGNNASFKRKSLGMLDDKDLLSQSAYFDEADSEIQSIYERVVLDRHMQSSLQEIIAAQKMHAKQSVQRQAVTSSTSPQAMSSSPKEVKDVAGMSPSAAAAAAAASTVTAVAATGVTTTVAPSSSTSIGGGVHNASARVDEDQRSDNTTSAGYMHVQPEGGSSAAAASIFQTLGLTEPESLTDETIAALFAFAQNEMGKRNILNPIAAVQSHGAGPMPVSSNTFPPSPTSTHVGSSSSGSNSSSTGNSNSNSNKPPSGRRSWPNSPLLTSTGSPSHVPKGSKSGSSSTSTLSQQQQQQQQRRPRSKSGGSEAAVLGLRLSVDTAPIIPPCDDDDVSESGRLPPTEKMLGLAPGYLAKPSPAASPWLGIEGVGGINGAPRASHSPTRPISSSSPLPIQVHRYGTPSLSANGVGSSGSSVGVGGGVGSSSGSGSNTGNVNVNGGSGGGGVSGSGVARSELHGSKEGGMQAPLRLPAKKPTATPLSVFTDYFKNYIKQQQQQQASKGQKNHRYRDDNTTNNSNSNSNTNLSNSNSNGMSNSNVSTSTIKGAAHAHAVSAPSSPEDFVAGMSLHMQHLVISPRTAFDDISVSSSVASTGSAASSNRRRSTASTAAASGPGSKDKASSSDVAARPKRA